MKNAWLLGGLLTSASLGMLSCSSTDEGGNDAQTDPSTAAGTGATAAVGGSVSNTAGAAGGTAAGSGGAGGISAGTGGTAAGAGGAPPAGTGGSDAGNSGTEAGTGGESGAGPSGGADGGTATPKANCLQGTGDFSEDGPYNVETTTVTIGSSGQFTIFVPDPLEADCPHPIVAWGNGTTVPGGTAYRHFNERMATWGIVVLASHDDGTAQSGPRIGDGSFHRAAIDYMLAENEDPSSEFFGKISGRAGVSGHSQGGAGGDRASTHPNVEANGNVQGSFGSAPADVAFLCLTGTEDIATEGCLNAVDSTSSPAMYASYDGMSHVATLSASSAGSQQYARLLTGWFRCFLADDSAACEMFQGGDACPVCQESGWDNIFAANY